MNRPRTALLLGATGLIGSHVLELLLASPDYASVVALVRRPLDRHHDKLAERVVDFEHLEEIAARAPIDDVYACLGTTMAVAGSRARFRQVDHDYTVVAARIALRQGARGLAVVSSIGASDSASNFYLRVKGETERDVAALGYETLELFRPSLLVGARSQPRRGEAVGIAVTRAVSWAMVGGLRAYRPIEASQVASAMVNALLRADPGTRIRSYDDILSLAG